MITTTLPFCPLTMTRQEELSRKPSAGTALDVLRQWNGKELEGQFKVHKNNQCALYEWVLPFLSSLCIFSVHPSLIMSFHPFMFFLLSFIMSFPSFNRFIPSFQCLSIVSSFHCRSLCPFQCHSLLSFSSFLPSNVLFPFLSMSFFPSNVLLSF